MNPHSLSLNTDKKLKIYCYECGQKLDVTGLPPFSNVACPNCSTTLVVPAWFDTYLLEALVGVGGMAVVYRALDVTLDREVAIKVLNPEIVAEENNIELFLHEARTSATINHQCVIPIYTCGVFKNQPYLVMQYMSCGSLQDIMDQHGPFLPIQNVLQWLYDSCEGLETSLRHGITHHDIKPGNIMLDMEQRAKIGDFGIANSIASKVSSDVESQLNNWVTPEYVSPEKVLYQTEDHRGDIYSLGATFFYLLTGRLPFNSPNVLELVKMRTTQPPPFVHEIRPEIPPEISSLIMGMMHLNPAKRPTYSQIMQTLQAFLPAHGGKMKVSKQARTLSSNKKSPNSKIVRPARTTTARTSVHSSNSGIVILFIILTAVVFAGIILFVIFRQNNKPSDIDFSRRDKFETVDVNKDFLASGNSAGGRTSTSAKRPGGSLAKKVDVTPRKAPAVIKGELPTPVTGSYLSESHSWQSSRPRFSPGYDFTIDRSMDYFAVYYDMLNENEKVREDLCIEILNNMRDDLVQDMNRMPYRNSPVRTIRGDDEFTDALVANKQYISIPLRGNASERINRKWSEIKMDQFIDFVRYYAELRAKGPDKVGAGMAYIKLGVLLDWQGKYDAAAEAIESAIQLDPSLRTKAFRYFNQNMM